jgi:hypothetical protein
MWKKYILVANVILQMDALNWLSRVDKLSELLCTCCMQLQGAFKILKNWSFLHIIL